MIVTLIAIAIASGVYALMVHDRSKENARLAKFWEGVARDERKKLTDAKAQTVEHAVGRAENLRDVLLLKALNRKLTNALEFYADEQGLSSGEDSNYALIQRDRKSGLFMIEEINEQVGTTERAGTMAKRILAEVNEVYAKIKESKNAERKAS